MSNAVFTHSPQPGYSKAPASMLLVTLTLAVWLGLIFWSGAALVFLTPRGTPPLALLIAVTAPVASFLISYLISSRFRDFVLSADIRLLTGTQAWRFGGFLFVVLYIYRILPGYFALPAGLGDMAIGITAPLIVVALFKDSTFVRSRTFVIWNVLGILDLVVAVTMGAVRPLLSDSTTQISTAPMAHLPLLLIPGFFVPLFLIFHITALMQARSRI